MTASAWAITVSITPGVLRLSQNQTATAPAHRNAAQRKAAHDAPVDAPVVAEGDRRHELRRCGEHQIRADGDGGCLAEQQHQNGVISEPPPDARQPDHDADEQSGRTIEKRVRHEGAGSSIGVLGQGTARDRAGQLMRKMFGVLTQFVHGRGFPMIRTQHGTDVVEAARRAPEEVYPGRGSVQCAGRVPAHPAG